MVNKFMTKGPRTTIGENSLCSKWCLKKKLDTHMQKNAIRPYNTQKVIQNNLKP